jgi:carbamoyltransferase
MTCWVLGVGASHNGGAALLRDGEVATVIQEERLTRLKRTRLFPAFDTLSITYCLEHAGIGPEDLSLIGVSCDDPVARRELDIARNPLFRDLPMMPPVAYVGHHRAHAAAASYQSGFSDAAVLVIDGQGSPTGDLLDEERAVAGREGWETLSMYALEDGALARCLYKDVARDRAWLSPGAHGMPRFSGIGGMYSAVSLQIFGQYLEAGKVMGLAPYGRPTIPIAEFLDIGPNGIDFRAAASARFPLDVRWQEDSDAYADLAASVQAALEEAVLWAGRRIHELTTASRLVYAGGVALNCIANERILRELPFDDVFIMPAAEDSGLAIGAAIEASRTRGLPLRAGRLQRDEMGRRYPPRVTKETISASAVVGGAPFAGDPATIANALAAGERVAWFVGGSELGPRSLGQRSILADPRDPRGKDELNRRKGRESFRPLAPVVLAEEADAWFDMGGYPESPFMLRVCRARDHVADHIPAAIHVDGTARVQTVDADVHPELHALISEFFARTGVPVLINTSLNAAGEPIAETPEDALWCAYRLHLDLAVLDGQAVRIAPQLGDDVVVRAADYRTIRDLRPERDALQVETMTPWGPAPHWVEGASRALLERLAAGPASVTALPDDSRALLEGLRRKRLLYLERAAESRQAGSGQCCRQGAAPPDGVG